MGKQAMGNVAFNQLNRMDTLLYLLCYPQVRYAACAVLLCCAALRCAVLPCVSTCCAPILTDCCRKPFAHLSALQRPRPAHRLLSLICAIKPSQRPLLAAATIKAPACPDS